MTTNVTVIKGDGIGAEVVGSTMRILDAAGANISWEECDAGAKVFKAGLASGVPQETIDSLNSTKVALKGPLETPVGFGEKSANVTLRKLFEMYANTRPVKEIPGVKTPFSGRNVDFVIVRENVEDLYAGIEYMQTPSVAECLKLITRKGCEKISRFAFELARSEGRKTVHCATKANIMKLTEGLLKKVFEEVATDYPEIEAKHLLVDNCAHQMVIKPEAFDVIVTTNMNGDILSDLGSGLVGGLGIAPGANIGNEVAVFEAVHGSAPDIAGKDIVNPTAVIFSGVMMLRHMGKFDVADTVEQALLQTLGVDKCFPVDLAGGATPVGTTKFTDTVIGNLGKTTSFWPQRDYKTIKLPKVSAANPRAKSTRIVGADIYLQSDLTADQLGQSIESIAANAPIKLKNITSRGVVVYPLVGGMLPDTVDHWRCRFVMRDEGSSMKDDDLCWLLDKIQSTYTWMHIEKLNEYDGVQAFTKAQGED